MIPELDPDFLKTTISVLALFISILSIISQRSFNRNSLKPICKIDVYSIKGSLRIILRNVGNGVMIIKRIRYYTSSPQKGTLLFGSPLVGPNDEKPITCLSAFLKDCPCETNSEYMLDNSGIGSSMSYNLLSRTFTSQSDLDATWDKIKGLTVEVVFKDTYNKSYKYRYNLDVDYKLYSEAKGKRDVVSGKTHSKHNKKKP